MKVRDAIQALQGFDPEMELYVKKGPDVYSNTVDVSSFLLRQYTEKEIELPDGRKIPAFKETVLIS